MDTLNLTMTTRYLILSCRTNQHVDNSKYRCSLFGGFSFAPLLSSFVCSDISLPRRYLSLDQEWLFPPADSSRHPFLEQLFSVSMSEIFENFRSHNRFVPSYGFETIFEIKSPLESYATIDRRLSVNLVKTLHIILYYAL